VCPIFRELGKTQVANDDSDAVKRIAARWRWTPPHADNHDKNLFLSPGHHNENYILHFLSAAGKG
jgi:hypothetical protein